jgi:hypothetical protein
VHDRDRSARRFDRARAARKRQLAARTPRRARQCKQAAWATQTAGGWFSSPCVVSSSFLPSCGAAAGALPLWVLVWSRETSRPGGGIQSFFLNRAALRVERERAKPHSVHTAGPSRSSAADRELQARIRDAALQLSASLRDSSSRILSCPMPRHLPGAPPPCAHTLRSPTRWGFNDRYSTFILARLPLPGLSHPLCCCAVLFSAVLCSVPLMCCGCAVLCCAVLCCAVLCCAVPCCAVLCCAVLCCAVLCC